MQLLVNLILECEKILAKDPKNEFVKKTNELMKLKVARKWTKQESKLVSPIFGKGN